MKLKTLFTKVENANEITQRFGYGKQYAIAVDCFGAFVENADGGIHHYTYKEFMRCARHELNDDTLWELRNDELIIVTDTHFKIEIDLPFIQVKADIYLDKVN